MRRGAATALALVLFLGACAGDDGAGDDVPAPATTTTAPQDDAAVRLTQVLLRERELAPLGFEVVAVARSFAAQRANRLTLCDQDVRAELRLVAGRQSRFAAGPVELSHTVTRGGDTNALLDRFRSVVDTCPGPWAEPPLPAGGGPVQREITGSFPLPDLGVDAAGAVIRSRNELGSTDTIVVVLVRGALVSSLSISGPVGSDFDAAEPAVRAAAERLLAAQSPAVP